MPYQSHISKEEKLMPAYKVTKDGLLLFGGNASSDTKAKPLFVTIQRTWQPLNGRVPQRLGYTSHFPGLVLPPLYPWGREILPREGHPIQQSFAESSNDRSTDYKQPSSMGPVEPIGWDWIVVFELKFSLYPTQLTLFYYRVSSWDCFPINHLHTILSQSCLFLSES